MKVNKNSWHYKVLSEKFCFMGGWDEWNISSSLCVYFWQVVFRLFTGVGLGLLVLSPFFSWTLIILDLTFSSILGALLTVMGLLVTFAAPFLGTLFVVVCVGEFIKNKLPRREYKEKEPNLIVEYIKAKKNKVCPIIEFVEGE